VAFRLAKEQCMESFMKWVSMAEHPSLPSPSAMQSVGCSRRGDYGTGLFFRGWAWPLSSSERNS